MARNMNEFSRDEYGRDIAEYAIAVVTILVLVIATLSLISDEKNTTFSYVESRVAQSD